LGLRGLLGVGGMQHTACRIPHITKLVKQKIFVSNPSVTGYAFREREKGSYLDFRILCELLEKAKLTFLAITVGRRSISAKLLSGSLRVD
jgi:hypothetical protein